jgi:AmmeMemoRadiSam system protein B
VTSQRKVTEMHSFWFFLAVFLFTTSAKAQDVRPVRDDVGFCWNHEQMKRLIGYLQEHETGQEAGGLKFVAGISPHDDYLYAGRMYYPLFQALRAKEVVIFGVTHGTVRKEIGDPQNILILDEYPSWRGLDGPVGISPLREVIRKRLDTAYFMTSNKAQSLEHSIEALVPFLVYFNPQVRITPVMVTAMPFERMEVVAEKLSSILAEYITSRNLLVGQDIVFLMSSDANHYGKDFNNIPFGEDDEAHTKGIAQDQRIAHQYLTGTVDSQKVRQLTEELKNVVWCGRYSVPFGLLTVQKTIEKALGRKITGSILRYSDTYTEGVIPLTKSGMGTTAPFSLKHWVGFLSAGYVLE